MIVNSINKVNKCTGCFACGDICPKNAISYKEGNDGFYYPFIDKDKCINCGKCLNVCPQLNHNKNLLNQRCYVGFSKDENIYKSSASGGIFSELARYVLKNKGIVFGAAFNGLTVKHIKISNVADLYKIQRSKYIQSYSSGIYRECKNELKLGKKVLFSGTPCQISALKNYLCKDYDNLITCDLVCHGVPSQSLFDKCIARENKRKNGIIKEFCFRYKTKFNSSPQTFRYQIIKKNGKSKIVIGNYYDFPFLLGFQKYLFLRESCYSCNYASVDRVGDFTLGDFWELSSKYNKEKGISMIIVNTQKAFEYFNLIKDNLSFEEVSIELAKECNECLNSPTKKNADRENFIKLANEDIDKAIYKYLTPKRKLLLNMYYKMPKTIKGILKHLINRNKLKKMW